MYLYIYFTPDHFCFIPIRVFSFFIFITIVNCSVNRRDEMSELIKLDIYTNFVQSHAI